MRKITALMVLMLALALPIFAQTDETDEPKSVEWPDQYYAPYVLIKNIPNYMTQLAETQGIRFFSIAFVLNGIRDCHARWNGSVPIDQFMFVTDLQSLRALGGDIIPSFGGAGGDELAMICPDVESLTAEYQRVIDEIGVTHLDFDIEGNEIEDEESIERRSEAIAALQAANEGLVISFTLPVRPTGLTETGIAILESAIEHGVEIGVVNIMTMNFGEAFPPDKMGENTIQAAESLFAQLQTLYPNKLEAELWAMIGLTPMLGVNNVVEEIFTVEDAALVTEFVQEKGIQRIAMWSLERDRECVNQMQVMLPDCSGTLQNELEFSSIFNQITK